MKNYGVWVGISLLLFSLFMVRESLKYPYYGEYGPGPGLFPLWLSGLMGLFSILFILDSLRKNNKIMFSEVLPKGAALVGVLKVVLSIFLFILISPFLGYIVSSIIVMLILLMPDFKWKISLSTAASVTIVLYVVFNLILDIPLPTNMLGW
ncbi:tripartite tricarboxylate transporter TctB family protein [Domibacillus sp. DTU_2020_1001157_1_SI_ALB_TIR_016]|uniref:tripartite tricarboxylate transporter TctB family protein n=1 Tax=unclassified Domibacillus TaxID=2632383 RepID=UPI001F577A51|nr:MULTISPECIES: tripartite tricarboxylate transporter TctB family protein [unclassified Domibacillus]MCI2257241.1 tripartite tricarboxylate transporter TctB family protein [Domibacillus sp. PGB-M46]WNS78391.1 tripartite tricarboxylate transporter TctB family protein [Domibacillus sp. DTU_2020_1001157_1_SI_ALB_TIR_016]